MLEPAPVESVEGVVPLVLDPLPISPVVLLLVPMLPGWLPVCVPLWLVPVCGAPVPVLPVEPLPDDCASANVPSESVAIKRSFRIVCSSPCNGLGAASGGQSKSLVRVSMSNWLA